MSGIGGSGSPFCLPATKSVMAPDILDKKLVDILEGVDRLSPSEDDSSATFRGPPGVEGASVELDELAVG